MVVVLQECCESKESGSDASYDLGRNTKMKMPLGARKFSRGFVPDVGCFTCEEDVLLILCR